MAQKKSGLKNYFYLIIEHCALWRSKWSASTRATIESTIGTALGKTHGSCRPLALINTSLPSALTVFCYFPIVAVGLKAIFISIFSPLLMPPCIPPELFDFVLSLFFSSDSINESLCSLPFK